MKNSFAKISKTDTVEKLKQNKLTRTQMEYNLRKTNADIKGYILPRCTGILQALISYYIRTSTLRCCSSLLVPWEWSTDNDAQYQPCEDPDCTSCSLFHSLRRVAPTTLVTRCVSRTWEAGSHWLDSVIWKWENWISQAKGKERKEKEERNG